MLKSEEFITWIETSHALFELFESRFDAYPLARRWVDEWYEKGCFKPEREELERLRSLVSGLNPRAWEIREEIWSSMSEQLHQLIGHLQGSVSNVGLAIAHYLSIWNIRRFTTYFERRRDFSLTSYFTLLGEQLEEMKSELARYRLMSLLRDRVEEDRVRRLFRRVNTVLRELGIGQDEPVGTIKVLHIFAPYYFPLLDNPIASSLSITRGKQGKISAKKYVEWMHTLKNWLQNYADVVEKLEEEYGESILKLVDEGLYIMCTVSLRKRVNLLGIH